MLTRMYLYSTSTKLSIDVWLYLDRPGSLTNCMYLRCVVLYCLELLNVLYCLDLSCLVLHFVVLCCVCVCVCVCVLV